MPFKNEWPEEDKARVVSLRQSRFKFADIARLMRRGETACREVYRREMAKAVRGSGTEELEAYTAPYEIQLKFDPLPVSTTARLCGDPLPGRSALDRKREAQHVG